LGPAGTFSHEAALALGEQATSIVAFPSILDVLDAVSSGGVDRAIVPIENAIEGTVSATMDGLVFDHELVIQHEIVLPIRLHLMAREGVTRAEVAVVTSYAHALAQCRKFLTATGFSELLNVASTAEAAQLVAGSSTPMAAIASRVAAETYGLSIIESNIEDHEDNETRFVVVGRSQVPAPTGHDRTTIVCFQDDDHPGSLYGILGRFAARDLNLTKVESRPTKRGIGDYCFIVEFEGHIADDLVADCLTDLQAHMTRVKFLGSYPVTGAAADRRREEVSTARVEATAWVNELRGRVLRG
jgi:prephenate dehydratase